MEGKYLSKIPGVPTPQVELCGAEVSGQGEAEKCRDSHGNPYSHSCPVVCPASWANGSNCPELLQNNVLSALLDGWAAVLSSRAGITLEVGKEMRQKVAWTAGESTWVHRLWLHRARRRCKSRIDVGGIHLQLPELQRCREQHWNNNRNNGRQSTWVYCPKKVLVLLVYPGKNNINIV